MNSSTPLSLAFTRNDPRVFGHSETLMKLVLQLSPSIVIIIASWVNWQQQEVIESFHAENVVLKEKLGNK